MLVRAPLPILFLINRLHTYGVLFPQQRDDEGKDIAGDDLVSCGRGVGLVGLHHPVDSEDALKEKGEYRHAVFFSNQSVGVVELFDVVGAVVRREGDAGEDDFGAAGFEGGDNLVEVGARVFDAKAAEAIVAAELDDDDGGLHGDDGVDALDAVFGGVAADAFVDDAIVITPGVEVGLKVVGIAFAKFGTVAGGEAVAEADDEGLLVVGCGWRRLWGGCFGNRGGGGRSRLLRLFGGIVAVTAGDGGH